jgi:hypothetical protein
VSDVDTAWQAALTAEQRAVFGYSLLGPRLPGAEQDLARTDGAAHSGLRDAADSAMTAGGLTPVAAAADYPELYPVDSVGQARSLAIRLEEECARAWRYLYAVAAAADPDSDTAARRTEAQAALSASAVRGTRWRIAAAVSPATVPFPGIS